jgi:hypothetical protein
MVDDYGQIFTIEGVAAGILMIVTAYLVVSTTTVLNPQDIHIIDMQLQQLGNDALAMMDTPDHYGNYSPLTTAIMFNNLTYMENEFLSYVNNNTNIDSTGYDRLNFSATISYYNTLNQVQTVPFIEHPYYRENAVKVTRWVYFPATNTTAYPYMRNTENQSVLLEVLLWRE